MKDLRKFYINGEWVDPTHSNDLEVENPANEEMVATISLGGETDVNLAVAAAKRAFASYSQTSIEERVALMEKLLQIYMDRYDEMSVAISVEMGAPISFATAAQADTGRGHINTALEALKQFEFERQVGNTRIVKEPIGVCGFITPGTGLLIRSVARLHPPWRLDALWFLNPAKLRQYRAICSPKQCTKLGFPQVFTIWLMAMDPMWARSLPVILMLIWFLLQAPRELESWWLKLRLQRSKE